MNADVEIVAATTTAIGNDMAKIRIARLPHCPKSAVRFSSSPVASCQLPVAKFLGK